MKTATTKTLIALLVFGAGACHGGADSEPPTLTGLMNATEIDVASKVPGRIKRLLVREGDHVDAGQKLVTLERHEIEAKMEQVRAAIEAAQAKLALGRKGARAEEKSAAADALNAARHQADVTRKMYERMQALRDEDAVSQSKFEQVEFKYKMAVEQLGIAESRHAIVVKGARKEEIDALEALVRQAQGTLAEVESYSDETEQSAQIAGEIAKVILHEGELAATGAPIVTIVDLSDQWATFAVREDLLRSVRSGDSIEVYVPALDRTEHMEVFHIAPMGDFATWRATSERAGFDLKSFEVKARPKEQVEGLRPGMTVRWSVGGG